MADILATVNAFSLARTSSLGNLTKTRVINFRSKQARRVSAALYRAVPLFHQGLLLSRAPSELMAGAVLFRHILQLMVPCRWQKFFSLTPPHPPSPPHGLPQSLNSRWLNYPDFLMCTLHQRWILKPVIMIKRAELWERILVKKRKSHFLWLHLSLHFLVKGFIHFVQKLDFYREYCRLPKIRKIKSEH